MSKPNGKSEADNTKDAKETNTPTPAPGGSQNKITIVKTGDGMYKATTPEPENKEKTEKSKRKRQPSETNGAKSDTGEEKSKRQKIQGESESEIDETAYNLTEDDEDTVIEVSPEDMVTCGKCQHLERVEDALAEKVQIIKNLESKITEQNKQIGDLKHQASNAKILDDDNKFLSKKLERFEKVKNENTTLKKDKTEAKGRIKSLEAQINDLQQKANDMKNQLRDKDRDLAQAKSAVTKVTDLHDEKTELERRLDKMNEIQEENLGLRQRMEMKDNRIEELQNELLEQVGNTSNTSENHELEAKIKELQQDKERLQEIIMKTSNPNIEKEEGIKMDRVANTNAGQAALKDVIVICDSNKRHIKEYFEKNHKTLNAKYYFINNVMTTGALVDKLEDIIANHTIGTNYSLMLGTNDARNHNITNDEIFRNLEEAIRTIRWKTGAMVQLLAIPPQEDVVIDAKINKINDKLKTIAFNDAGIVFTVVPELKSRTRKEILNNDGFHLTPKGAEYIAREINTSDVAVRELSEIQVNQELVKHIIGEKGSTIQSLKRNNNCEVQIRKQRGVNYVTIRGPPRGIDRVEGEITTLEYKFSKNRTKSEMSEKSEISERISETYSTVHQNMEPLRIHVKPGSRHVSRDPSRDRARGSSNDPMELETERPRADRRETSMDRRGDSDRRSDRRMSRGRRGDSNRGRETEMYRDDGRGASWDRRGDSDRSDRGISRDRRSHSARERDRDRSSNRGRETERSRDDREGTWWERRGDSDRRSDRGVSNRERETERSRDDRRGASWDRRDDSDRRSNSGMSRDRRGNSARERDRERSRNSRSHYRSQSRHRRSRERSRENRHRERSRSRNRRE